MMNRKLEIILASIGFGLTAIFLGGYSMVINRLDEEAFIRLLYPAMVDSGISIPKAESFEFALTLSAWFGFTLVLVSVLFVLGIFFTRRRPRRWWGGGLFFASGLVSVIGSQLVAAPFAFFFFVSAIIFFFRRPDSPK